MLGFTTVIIAAGMEIYGAKVAGLWAYTGGNWPYLLWVTYFFIGMFGYALVEAIDRGFKKI
jgi:hypothetical protein